MARWVKRSLDNVQPYSPGKRASEVRLELGLPRIIKLSSNESPFGPVPRAAIAMRQALKGLNRYPDGACHLLRNKLADHLDAPFEALTVGNGSNELIRLLAQVVLEPGDEVVMAAPSFIVYSIVAALVGATAIEVPLADLAHDLRSMAAAVTDKTKLIFVCNPNNPTGTVVSADDCREFIESVPAHVLVCFDEAYHEFVTDPAYRTSLELFERYRNLVVFRTFSKIYGLAGARIGYGVAPPEIVEAIDKAREPFNVNLVGQVGAYYSLGDQSAVERRSRGNREQRELVEGALDELGFQYAPSQANFIYFNPGVDASEAFERLKQRGVIVRVFGNGNYLRATIGSPNDNKALIAALGTLRGDGH